MELPRRARGDELLEIQRGAGELRHRLRRVAPAHDLATVIACGEFDHRTRMLPFIYADTLMAPAGRAGHRLGDGG